MPLPLLLLGGAALFAGSVGVKKGIDASADSNRASELNTEAKELFDAAEIKLKSQKNRTEKNLSELGEVKLAIWDEQMGRFVELYSKLKDVELTGGIGEDETLLQLEPEALQQMREISLHASEVVGGGLSTLGAGALAGFGAYGGATMFAAASTGTAISSLTGVAATNATLAWFGGGSLAAGGLGMAGGMAVLGGIVAGPALLIGGVMLSAKAKEKLASARGNYAEASKAAEEMNCASTALNGIERIAEQFIELFEEMIPRFDAVLDNFNTIIKIKGTSYLSYSEAERKIVYTAVEFAHLTKKTLEIPLLSKDGALKRGLGRHIKAVQNSPLLLDEEV